MKKFLILFLMVFMTFSLSAYDLGEIEDGFQSFADETANALPLASNMGLNWNDAYSGNFPHFGIGLTAGAVFLPSKAFEKVYTLTGDASGMDAFPSVGIPLPIYSVDGRLGIPVLPMDVGFKFGALSPDTIPMDEISVGFKMVGFDVRWAVLEDKGLMPDLSVGVGYTWLSGDIIAPVDPQSFDLTGTGDLTELTLEDSDMFYKWSANIFDIKAQVSKKLLLLNISGGLGYSMGVSQAGGGITGATVKVDGQEITSAEMALIEAATGLSIDDSGLDIMSKVSGGSFRVFGGVGINLFILKLDVGLLYGLPSKTMGVTTNVRIQY
ncbi:hypothetical protein [Oceanispirochaeta sp.]|jgi:hypothetical protein|uniref:hypothetical protein n=1 Tax=Oceanispirochaeta sp. TaxID=2035350 RepID=UPI00261519D0|nr:hypothetical protein [Oceanispirochaeta sp.]MDA3957036.1 hypothetical protein [Oceanispirochaeta sp.]